MSGFTRVPVTPGRTIRLAGGKEWVVYNSSPFVNLDVMGGPNSQLFCTLLPMGGIVVSDPAYVELSTKYEECWVSYVENKLDTLPTIPAPSTPTPTDYLAGRTFCIDAGHGGKDPGAVNPSLGLQEKVAALDIALLLGSKLAVHGASVVYTRTSDTYPGLSERAQLANSVNATAFISIHLNSAENTSATGTEVLVYKKNSVAGNLAEKVLKYLIPDTGFKNRGVKERPDLTVLIKTKMPAILVEVGFISNDSEAQLLFRESYQKAMANAITKGVLEQFGEM